MKGGIDIFEVFRTVQLTININDKSKTIKQNQIVMRTDDISCIPDKETLKCMANTNYKFRYNNDILSLTSLLKEISKEKKGN